MQQPGGSGTQQTAPEAPQGGGRAVTYLWIAAAVAVLLIGGLLVSLKLTTANADYICTKVVETGGACSGGSWSAWQPVSETMAGDSKVITMQRTYTGVREVSKRLQYLSLRTACQSGYSQAGAGEGGGASGFHGGSVMTTSSACQVVQTQTMTQAPRAGGARVTWSVTNDVTDNGPQTTQSNDVGSLGELNTHDTTAGGNADAEGSAEIEVRPSLVRAGDTTTVIWQSAGVATCTILGSNGDSWVGTLGSQVSAPIMSKTTFTLSCPITEGLNLTAEAEVNVVPVFQEI